MIQKILRYIVPVIVLMGLILLALLIYQHPGDEKNADKSEKMNEDNYEHLVVAIPFTNASGEDIDLLEQKINEITEKKAEIHVEFVRTDSYSKDIYFMLARNEQIDIMYANRELFEELFVKDMLMPLDTYLEQEGQGIREVIGEKALSCGTYSNQLYEIPVNGKWSCSFDSYMLCKDILDKYHINPEDIRSQEDLEKVFSIVHQNEPQMTVLASGTGSMGTMLFGQYISMGLMGGFSPGVHEDYGLNENLENVFESEEYINQIKKIRKWYLQGYLGQDILGETDTVFHRIKTGKLFAYTIKVTEDDSEERESNLAGKELVCIHLGRKAVSNDLVKNANYLIPRNSKDPANAMKLLNLFYTDRDIENLLCYGVEGVHYKKTEDGSFDYVDGDHGNPFMEFTWRMPNQMIAGHWKGTLNTDESTDDIIYPCDFGFNFDIREIYTEYSSLKDIYNKYKPVLENGLVNPESGLKDMLSEMKENGLEDVLKEEKRQYQNWKE